MGCSALANCMDECNNCHDDAVSAVNCAIPILDSTGECDIKCNDGNSPNGPDAGTDANGKVADQDGPISSADSVRLGALIATATLAALSMV